MKIIALALLFLILAPQVAFTAGVHIGLAATAPVGHSFTITYTATFENIDSQMDRVQVYLPVPREWDSQKAVQIESISPQPNSINEDPDYGNKMAYFLFSGGIPPKQSREVTIQYTFTFYETHIFVDPMKVRPYNLSDPTYIKYTKQRPSEWVESDDPVIEKAASEIIGRETNPYLKAKRIYDWMVENIEYKFPSPWGARETYLKRAGDCGKYTSLFCAMAISQGIPCRAVSGLIFQPPFPRTYSSKGSPIDPSAYGSHVYAEFYLADYGWIPVDASIGRSSGRPGSYLGETWDAFLICSKGFGIRTVPPSRVRALWIFQHYAWWFEGEARKYDSYYTYTVARHTVASVTTQTTTSTTINVSVISEAKDLLVKAEDLKARVLASSFTSSEARSVLQQALTAYDHARRDFDLGNFISARSYAQTAVNMFQTALSVEEAYRASETQKQLLPYTATCVLFVIVGAAVTAIYFARKRKRRTQLTE